MLTCIDCSKQLNNTGSLRERPPQDDENAVGTPSTKQAIKALTVQIKDMAVKASGAYKHCKLCSGNVGPDHGNAYADSDVGSVSERFYGSYRRTGRSKSTQRDWGKEMEAKVSSGSGSATPASVSGRIESIVFMEEDEPKEWTAQVEPGVLITFVSLPHTQGENDLKRIRFSREIFNKWQAQHWWAENYDKVMELYNVQKLDNHAVPLPTPPQCEYEISKLRSSHDIPVTPPLNKERVPRHLGIGYSSSHSPEQQQLPAKFHPYHDLVGHNSTPKLSSISAAKSETTSVDAASARSSYSRETASCGDLSVSNTSDVETSEWVEQDEPGVYITIRQFPGGTRELRRVRFSRERFGEMRARLWWEENRARIQQQYL